MIIVLIKSSIQGFKNNPSIKPNQIINQLIKRPIIVKIIKQVIFNPI